MNEKLSKLKLFQNQPTSPIVHDLEVSSQRKVDVLSSKSNNPVPDTVSVFTNKLKNTLERSFPNVYISGEISNLSKPYSGHIYATLKDSNSQISIVIFKGVATKIKFNLKDGLELVVRGKVSVYNQRGNYQLICNSVEPKGVGSLQLAYEELKEKLNREGLFENSRKKSIPFFPKKIGIVTSLTGAALKDIMVGLQKRCPIVNVVLCPVTVQGEKSAFEIADGIARLNKLKDIDVLIVGRGGGSLEDLWSFNEEIVARAIAKSDIPIISAVGHEIDVSIADFVADVKAMTPTHASMLVVPDYFETFEKIKTYERSLLNLLRAKLDQKKLRLNLYKKALSTQAFLGQLQNKQQFVDQLSLQLKSKYEYKLNSSKHLILNLKTRLKAIGPVYFDRIQSKVKDCDHYKSQMNVIMNNKIIRSKNDLNAIVHKLELLSPIKVLDRGYSITRSENKEIVKDSNELKVGDTIESILNDKTLVESKILKIKKETIF